LLLFGFYPTEPLDNIILILSSPGFWVYLVFLVILMLLERVITWVSRRAVTSVNLPKSAANNLIVSVRLILLIAAIVAAFPLFGFLIPENLLVAITASLSTAIALFASFSLSNVVAGIYIFFTRPFAVGDYVTIGTYEGIIEEISINYTTLYSPSKMFVTLPNQTVINSPILNYKLKERLHEGEYLKAVRAEAFEKEKAARKKEKGVIKRQLFGRREVETIASIFRDMKIYGYSFDLGVRIDDYAGGKIESNFARIVKKWKPEFGYTPWYLVWKIDGPILTFRFIITVDDPTKIIEYRDNFMKELLEAVSPKKS